MDQPILSACIVLYHSGDKALDAIRCLKESSLPAELFVVDNAPEMPAGENSMAARVLELAPDAHYIPMRRNEGFGRANNMVLQFNLKSRYHLMFNPDVVFSRDLLKNMIDYMEKEPNCVILTPKVLNLDGTEQFLPKEQPRLRYLAAGPLENKLKIARKCRDEYTHKTTPDAMPSKVRFATGCFLLIRTDVFREMEGFDERFFLYQEDSDLGMRAMQHGDIVYHPDMKVYHAWARENTRSLKGILHHLVSTAKYFWKWGL